MPPDAELTRLVDAVNAARDREAAVARAAHLDYCRATRDLVEFEERERGKRGAQSRTGRLLGMTAQNVSVMLRQLREAEPTPPAAAQAPEPAASGS